MTNKNYALNISLAYFLFGVLWILLSDSFIESFSLSKEAVTFLSIIKGWSYIGLSAILIYLLNNRYIKKLTHTNQHLQESYAELTSTHEELIAIEEELRQQFDEIFKFSEKIKTQNGILSTIQETLVGLINQHDINILLSEIIRSATVLAGTAHGFICLVDREREIGELKVGLGLFQDQVGLFKMKLDAGQIGQVLQTGQISLIENYTTWQHRLNSPHLTNVESMIQVPLKSNQAVIGTLGLAYTVPNHHFNTNDCELLERFATIACIIFNNAQLHTQLKQDLAELKQKEETIRAIFNATNDAIVVHNANSAEVVNCNRKAEELFGITLEEAQLMNIEKLDASYCNSKLVEAIRSAPVDSSQLIEWSGTNKQGKCLYLETNHCKVTIGGTQCVLAVTRDISKRKKADDELTRVQNQKLALLKAIPDLMLLFDDQGVLLDYNQPANFELSIPAEKFMGNNISHVFSAAFTQNALGHIQKTILTGEIQLFEYQLLQNNQIHYFEARFVKSGATEVLAIVRDITYKKQMEQQLEYLSLHDALTEVYNRTYFEEELRKIRSQNEKNTGIIVCDVDGLKLINDTLGHHAGDELLKVVTKILQSCATSPDIVSRIGGDEFAIIVFEPNREKMARLSTTIKESVEFYNKEHLQLPLSLSIGWAVDWTACTNIDELFKEADSNMYREKMHHNLSTRSAIVQAMMQALEARDFITEGHGDRLQTLVANLARKLQLSDPMIADLKLLAKFHDIGKVGIPDNILFKPSRLTDDEVIIMRRHCDIGFRIAKSAPDLAPIAEWILKHQEWWNGQGYPLGLSGEEIPLACRILSLADAFDAMTNDRPYREAMQYQESINEIRKFSGIQFDPALTEPFIEILTIL